jgi:hypothetical protein
MDWHAFRAVLASLHSGLCVCLHVYASAVYLVHMVARIEV